MTTLTEGNLEISFPENAKARKFDDNKKHGLSHCMKAVDFVVEEEHRIYFIEFKDPEKPGIEKKDKKDFESQFYSHKLNEVLKYKFRDTFLYEWACDSVDKPIYFLVLVVIESLSELDLMAQTEDLKRKLPMEGPRSGKWKRPIVSNCMVYNMETWNRNIPHFPVARIEPV